MEWNAILLRKGANCPEEKCEAKRIYRDAVVVEQPLSRELLTEDTEKKP